MFLRYVTRPVVAFQVLLCASLITCFEAAQAFTTVINVPPDVAPSTIGSDTQLNLFDGGSISPFLYAGNHSEPNSNIEVNVAGGSVDDIDAYSGSTINVSGGQLYHITADSSEVNISGGQFFAGDIRVMASSLDINGGTGLETVLIDTGSTAELSDISIGGTVSVHDHSVANLHDIASVGYLDIYLYSDASIYGSMIQRDVDVYYGTLNLHDSTIENDLNASYGNIHITDGSTVNNLSANHSTIQLDGGTVGDVAFINGLNTLNITDGSIGDDLYVLTGNTVNMHGGTIGDHFSLVAASTLNLDGGSIGESFWTSGRSHVNLTGQSFILDGTDLTAGLVPGVPMDITDRDVTLEGMLADGSMFSFDLNSTPVYAHDYFDPDSTITITLVPEPGTIGLIGIGLLSVLRRRRVN